MSQKVTIQYEGETYAVLLKNLNGQYLQDIFELDFTPTLLKNVVCDTVVRIADKEEIELDGTYIIVKKKTGNIGKSQSRSWWDEDDKKSIVQNALIASRATYIDRDDDCEEYLLQNLTNHNFSNIIRSKSDSCPFIVAEEVDENRLYVAFRGTQSTSDWRNNLKAFRLGLSQASTGKFHAGFLERAQLFPLQKILNEEKYDGKDIVFCGHSMGGAVATIVAILACLEQDKHRKAVKDGNFGRIQCFTFGSPMVADGDIKKFCDKKGLSKKFYHCVNFNDPVPRLLSYGMTLQAIAANIDKKVSALANQFSTEFGTDYYKGLRDKYIGQKTDFMQNISKIEPYLDGILQISCLIFPQSTAAVGMAKMAKDIIKSLKENKSSNSEESTEKLYAPIGNFLFISDNRKQHWVAANFDQDKIVNDNMEVSEINLEDQLEETNAHVIETYQKCLIFCGMPEGKFQEMTQVEKFDGDYGFHTTFEPRKVDVIYPYLPTISEVELVKVSSQSDKDRLRLRLTGANLFYMDLTKCQFNLGFPFGANPEKTKVKKIITSQHLDTVTLEEDFTESPDIPDHGLKIVFATLFGACDFLLQRQQVRDIVIPNINQLAHHDTVPKVIKMAIQRGMGITQIKRQATGTNLSASDEPIITKVKTLARNCLGEPQKEKFFEIFDDKTQKIEFILSNEREYEVINSICEKINDHLRSPLKIEADAGILKSIGIAVATLLGGAAIAAIAGPGLLLVGAIEAISMMAVGAAGAVGGAAAGIATNVFWNEKIVDKNYSEVLNFIVTELFKNVENNLQSRVPAPDPNTKDKLVQRISDLREDGKTYSLEEAILIMYDKEKGNENFKGTLLENCKESSLKSIHERIECISAIHDIRNILARQCYIGIVGIQDAGKTTLISKLWGIQGKTGLFTHTEVPLIHEISRQVYVVDFPGSNSLDYHAKTFSVCGAMNNMILLIIPFTGDINQLISDEIAKVFSVMQGSESTQVVLCINKCGPFLKEIKDELGPDGNAEKLSERFAEKLNMYYESNDAKVQIAKENILFTDWLLDESDQEALEFGLIGVGEIRKKIRSYLIKYNIYGENEDELEDILTFNLKI